MAAPASQDLLTGAAARGDNLGSITAALLRLLDRYGAAELQAAIGEALARGVPHPNAVRLALEQRREQRHEGPPVAVDLPAHVKSRDKAEKIADAQCNGAAARPYYDYYHRSIRRFIDEIRSRYPAGLLIDVHGQKKDPSVVMRGTQNGRTVARLLERAGVPAVTGANGIFGQLEANGLNVYPANGVPPAGTSENGGYSGGYTVGTYGSHAPDGIDAVQMEFGTRYRGNTAVDKAAEDAGKAIAAFYEAYLKKPQN
jgi:hypothetical protein